MKRLLIVGVGLALVLVTGNCAKPGSVLVAGRADSSDSPCATIGYEYALAYGPVERIVADVRLTYAQFIEQGNAKAPPGGPRDGVPDGAEGAALITVCQYDGNFTFGSPDGTGVNPPREVSRVSIIVKANGEAYMRSIGPRARIPVVSKP